MTVAVDVAANLARIRERVARAAERAGRDPDEITVIAVGKTMPFERILDAVRAGVRDLGENRVQEAREKFAQERPAGVTLHLIGHLQTNKARQAVQLFDVVHSVESERLAQVLAAEAERAGTQVPVLIEVNVAGEATKFGVAPSAVGAAVGWVTSHPSLRLLGLMTIAPEVADPEEVRWVFRTLRELRDAHCPEGARALSMGMTNDFEVAIAEGATHVRIGRAIFGPRPA